MKDQVKNETARDYSITARSNGDDIIQAALAILDERVKKEKYLTSSATARDYLIMRAANHEREVFSVMFLDNQHGVIAVDDLFYGTIDGAAVHPREVVKAALAHNAAAIILTHNHPSGKAEPSQADISITRKLRDALNTVDVRVLDHIVTAGGTCTSFAERGLL